MINPAYAIKYIYTYVLPVFEAYTDLQDNFRLDFIIIFRYETVDKRRCGKFV